MMKLTLEDARGVLAAQPFSVMLGAVLTRFDEGGVELELDVDPRLLQQNGFVHGGVLCYLADNALTFAGGLNLGRDVLTSGVALTYLRPAQGDLLIARASTQGSTSRTAATQVAISARNADGEYLCAVGSGTVTAVGR